MEITFTALGALRRRELPLIGQTSLWMFPIYGCAAFFQPAFLLLRHCHLLVRGTVYALSIFGAEYTSGRFLKKHELCPWNYNRCRWHVNGLIPIILNAAPFIQRIHRDADILFSIFVNAQTRSAVSRLVHESCLGTKHFPVCILILYPAQKQIG